MSKLDVDRQIVGHLKPGITVKLQTKSGEFDELGTITQEPNPSHGSNTPPEPQTSAEAKMFYEGVRSGLTKYAREVGHSTLRRDNPLLARLLDEAGWQAIERFEKFGDDDDLPKG